MLAVTVEILERILVAVVEVLGGLVLVATGEVLGRLCRTVWLLVALAVAGR